MAPVQRKLRKALGAVKDQTSIGLAKVASSRAPDLDIAVVKATSHSESPVDDKYVHDLLQFMSYSRQYATACVGAVARRLSKTRNWVVALKSLMLVHRLLRDGEPSFDEEFVHGNRVLHILNMSGFRDHSSSSAWDYSGFVRTYAMYLDERLRSLPPRLQENKSGGRRGHGEYLSNAGEREEDARNSKKEQQPTNIKDMKPEALLQRLPDLQQLLERVIGCGPTGAARTHRLVQIALYSVVIESSLIYADIFDGVTILLDGFFDLEYNDSVKALDIYKLSAKQASSVASFYGLCKNIGIGRPVDYPNVQPVSQDSLDTFEEYVRNMPKGRGRRRSRSPEPQATRVDPPPQADPAKPLGDKVERAPEWTNGGTAREHNKGDDLLNMDEPAISADEQHNSLALALFSESTSTPTPKWEPFGPSTEQAGPPNGTATPAESETGQAGWELALVEESTNIRAAHRAQMAGGFDNLLLESMYEQGAAVQQAAVATSFIGGSASSVALPNRPASSFLALPAPPGAGPLPTAGGEDPFAASAAVPPPAYVQMADLGKKQSLLQQEQLAWQRYQADGMQGYHGFMRVNNNPYLTGSLSFNSNRGLQGPGPYAHY